jgi:hypothetical protein
MEKQYDNIMRATLTILSSSLLLGGSALSQNASYYTSPPLFSTAPAEEKSLETIGRFGPVGMAIELHQPAFTMWVGDIEPGSPAAAAGALKKGQVIESINGQPLKDIDPRIQLGQIIAAAEATDGIVKFAIKGEPAPVVVKIPLLGAYSKTWPLNCPKSDKIVRNFADHLAKPDSNKGFADIGMLFLLSTGEDKDLAPVKQWVHDFAGKPAPTYAWHLGFGGIPLCEYFLRTGDPVARPVIQCWVNAAAKGEYLDGWAGRGGVPGVDYGNGHLNAGGTAVVTFLLLAKECGAEVNDSLLQRTLRHFFRFAGRGNNPYGDDRPETSFVDNGKNGNLAFAMAAAASLTPNGEKSLYAAARDICAMTGFYTTTYMLHGHTGGGIGELWRSSAMGLLYDKKPLQYREFMDHRQWHYELSRRFNGAFTILGGDDTPKGGCYDTEDWGAGYALTYTIPRKTLRITGAPLSKNSKQYALPARPWGTAADDVFLSLEAVTDADGKCLDLSGETLANNSAKPLIERLLAMGDVGDDVLRRTMHHPDFLIRNLAAKNAMGIKFNYMWVTPGDRTRPALIQEWLRSPDPRVRRAALGVLAQFLPAGKPESCLTPEVFASVITMLRDPAESWWVKDAALNLVGLAPADWVAPHVDLLVPFLKHEEQWLQNAALIALTPVVADERCYQKVLPAIGELLRTCQRVSTINPLRWGVLPKNLAAAGPEVQKLAATTLKGSFAGFAGVKTAEGGQDITSVYETHKSFLASYLAGVDGGYDALYEIAKDQFPKAPLPYSEIFLAADPEKFSPKLQQVIKEIIRDKLVYEFIGKNRARLLAEIDRTTQNGITMGILDDLTALYNKIGVHEYDWHAFGPDLKNAKWDYFTFDPPEKQAYDLSPWRYRSVTCPQGMGNWFAPEFDPAKAGWKQGLPPFGQYQGKLAINAGPGVHTEPWPEPPRTLWENEVLLVRGSFQFPPFKPGHLYRLRAGTGKGVGAGDGFRIHLNGEPWVETKEGLGRHAGHLLRGGWITKDLAREFAKGPVTIAAIAFLRYGDRAIVQMPPVPQGIFSLWLEEMKLPPVNDESLRKSATFIPMLSAAWQEKQDPQNKELQTAADKFRYDGKFAANPKLIGSWTAVAVVPAIGGFDPAKPADADRAPIKSLTVTDGGLTDSSTLIWSGDTLMDLESFQALKMNIKPIAGSGYLFIEAGGFSIENPVGWKSPLIVMKRVAK